MKSISTLLLLFLCLKGFSQDPRLISNTWYFSQLEQGSTVSQQPIPFRTTGTSLTIDSAGDFITFAYNDIVGNVTFDPNNVELTIISAAATLAFANDPAIDGFDLEYADFYLGSTNQVYTYSIATAGTLQSLRITNPAGKTAVYQNRPLSEISNQLAITQIFLSPDGNQITVDSKEISLSLLSFELFDLAGKRVLQSDDIKNKFIDISTLKGGFYIFKLSDENGVSKTFKFSKS